MLCCLQHSVIFIRLGLLSLAVAVLVQELLTEAALPPGAEDEVVLIEHLPGRRVHLQDFFWTGAEDAPSWLDPDQTLTLYETRTIHHTATVYLPDDGKEDPGHVGPQDPGCVSCIEPTPTLPDVDQDIGVLIGEDPGPRYWLLTVLRAGETVPPQVELRLARLYRTAFSRQQQRHLGLLSTDARIRRAARKRALRDRAGLKRNDSRIEIVVTNNFSTTTEANFETTVKIPTKVKHMRAIRIPKNRTIIEDFENVNNKKVYANTTVSKDDRENFRSRLMFAMETNNNESILDPSLLLKRLNETPVPFHNVNQFQEKTSGSLHSLFSIAQEHISDQSNLTDIMNMTKSKLRIPDVGTVQVRMTNTSVIEGGATRLIYSVHLGGKPVPAATAAKDMALLSEQEVAIELGAPVIIQSEPFLKETLPLALSRKRDIWLLAGAAGAGIILLAFILTGLFVAAKRKRAHSAVSAPPPQSILKKDREYTSTTPGLDNTGYTSETEARTDGTSRRQTPGGSLSRSPVTSGTPESVLAEVHDISSDNEEDIQRSSPPWREEEPPGTKKLSRRRVTRTNAIDPPRTPDSMDTVAENLEALESLENGYAPRDEVTTSPHSYLSMPSCKQFPRMRSVEPLSRVLEPVVVRHLDMEFDSPEPIRKGHLNSKSNDQFLTRTPSAAKDPGVVGPIVWDLRRQKAIEDTTSETDPEPAIIPGPVGRARRRLHELLEDSFSLFGSRDAKPKEEDCQRASAAATRATDDLTVFSEIRGRSAHVSPVATPTSEVRTRPRTSLPRTCLEETIPETGNSGPHPRGAWGSRPLSAGPFHRPNLPEVDTLRILADPQLPPEDPAVPLIAAIKKELEKFST
ncbi:uncharacterized protein LOC107266895 isoform X2 [Cephus cinctus]|uniref:Uncharacterized protein LOC107266895 isoform X2 n=1 Tax=Cephus cinctus TaxID=211228 RepID=A0AAJ7FIG0_CEPCN|nr:uncharacterized protein LOC107266895 isoform X2 [Cephus cinctus]